MAGSLTSRVAQLDSPRRSRPSELQPRRDRQSHADANSQPRL